METGNPQNDFPCDGKYYFGPEEIHVPDTQAQFIPEQMTVRDTFACAAMIEFQRELGFATSSEHDEKIALRSYELADAMMAEREKRK